MPRLCVTVAAPHRFSEEARLPGRRCRALRTRWQRAGGLETATVTLSDLFRTCGVATPSSAVGYVEHTRTRARMSWRSVPR